MGVRTVVLGPPPAELEALLARRRALGQDLFDEVWEGEYHMSLAPHPRHGSTLDELIAALRPVVTRAGLRGIGQINLGEPDDYRVPDYSYAVVRPTVTFVPTAVVVVEVVSPDDETYDKFGFYARHGVEELVIAEPLERRVRLFARDGDGYTEVPTSARLGVDAATLTTSIDWPPT